MVDKKLRVNISDIKHDHCQHCFPADWSLYGRPVAISTWCCYGHHRNLDGHFRICSSNGDVSHGNRGRDAPWMPRDADKKEHLLDEQALARWLILVTSTDIQVCYFLISCTRPMGFWSWRFMILCVIVHCLGYNCCLWEVYTRLLHQEKL